MGKPESRAGIEPANTYFADRALSQLGYLDMERMMGLEPTVFALATRCSTTELHPRNRAGRRSRTDIPRMEVWGPTVERCPREANPG